MAKRSEVARSVASDVQEIRERAVDNIASKIDSGLLSRDDASVPEIGLYPRLVQWLGNGSWRRPPSFWKLLNLLMQNDAAKTAEVAAVLRASAPLSGVDEGDDPNLKEVLAAVDRVPRDDTSADDDASSLTFESFRRVAESSALPRHLLRHQSAVDSLSSSKPLTPVARTYFKRVHFSEGADVSRREHFRVKLPWLDLNRHDSDVLAEVMQNLEDDEASSLDTLRYKTLADFPAEVFLQRPDIFHTLLEKYTFSSDPAVQQMSCDCLCELASRLRTRYESHEEMGDTGRTGSKAPNADGGERQIDLYDFCLLSLSAAATVMRSGAQDHLGLLSSTGALLSGSAKVARATGLVRRGPPSYVQDILRDVLGDLTHAAAAARQRTTSAEPSPVVGRRRRAFVVIAKSVVECADLFAGAGEDFGALASAFCEDETVFMSHPDIYDELLKHGDRELKESHARVGATIGRLDEAVAFLRGSSDSEEGAREAALFYPFHQSQRTAPNIFRVLKTVPGAGLSETALFLLQSNDIQLQTAAYLQLHKAVKESLGIARAVDPGSGAAENVVFHLGNSGVFEEVTGGGLFHGSANIRSACEEILVYTMKSGRFVAESQWARLRDAFVKRFPVIECCAAREASICGDNILRAVARPAGKFDVPNIVRIQVNTRLLFSKKSSVRCEALVNLKFLLPHEGVKDVDRNCAHVLVNLRPGAVSMPTGPAGCSPAVSAVSLVAVTEALKGTWSTEADLKLALSQLELIVQDPGLGEEFLTNREGVALLAKVLKSSLEGGRESRSTLGKLISAVKAVVCLSGVAREQIVTDGGDGSLFLRLLSCLFVDFEDPMCKSDLAVTIYFLLFKDFLHVTAAGQIQVNRVVAEHTNVPFECLQSAEHPSCELSPHAVGEEHLPMLKTAWNIAWFGGVRETVDASLDAKSADFSESLQMTALDGSVLAHSFLASECGLDMLAKSGCHEDVCAALDYLRTVPRQSLGGGGALEAALSRFLLRIPKECGDDLRLFFEVVRFTAWAHGDETAAAAEWLDAATANMRLFQAFDASADWKLRDAHAVSALYSALPRKGVEEIPSALLKWSGENETFLSLETLTSILESDFAATDWEMADFVERVETRLVSHRLSFDNSASGLKMLQFLDAVIHKGGASVRDLFQSLLPHLVAMCQRAVMPAIKASGLKVVSALVKKLGRLGHKVPEFCRAESTALWRIGLSSFMKPQEPMMVRNQAANLILVLLPSPSRRDACMWPTVHESVTGLTLTGDAALLLLLRHASFEDFALGVLGSRDLRGKVRLPPHEVGARARTLDLMAAFLTLDPGCIDARAALAKILETAVDFSDSDVDVPRKRPPLLARALRSELEAIDLLMGVGEAGDVVAAHISSVAALTSSALFLMGEGGRRDAANLNMFHSLSRVLYVVYSDFLEGFKRDQVMNKYIVPVVNMTVKIFQDRCAFALRLSLTRMLESVFCAIQWGKKMSNSSNAAARLNSEKNGQPPVTKVLCQELLREFSALERRHGSASSNPASLVHLRTLSAVFAESFAAQDCALQSDLLPLLSRQLDSLAGSAESGRGAREDDLCNISEALSLLNNLCFKNVTAKSHVARKTVLVSQLHQLHPIIAGDAVCLGRYLHFLTTLCVDCDAACRSLVVAQRAGISREMKRTCSVIAFLVELLRRNVAPEALYRLLTIAVGNAECRDAIQLCHEESSWSIK